MNATYFEIRPARRTSVRPLIVLYGESGSGKSYSALLLARGFVGPEGKIVVIDTESGRGELYSDIIPGGYSVLSLSEPFSPSRHIEAVRAVEQSGAQMGIVDSGSHEWEGVGGVLDMAAQIEERTGKTGLHIWRAPKLDHAKFVGRLLQSTIPWLVCLRAKYKSRQVKNPETGKNEIVKDKYLTPLQDDGFVFEAAVHGELDAEHKFYQRKSSHAGLSACFPNGQPIATNHGEALAKWCAGVGCDTAMKKPTSASPAPSAPKQATEKTREWMFAQLKDYDPQLLADYAESIGWLAPGDNLNDWPLAHVPMTKEALRELMRDIEAFKEGK